MLKTDDETSGRPELIMLKLPFHSGWQSTFYVVHFVFLRRVCI